VRCGPQEPRSLGCLKPIQHALWYSVAEPRFRGRMDTKMDTKTQVDEEDSEAGLGVHFGVHFSTKRGRFGGFQRL
jgi:hypothetical protein